MKKIALAFLLVLAVLLMGADYNVTASKSISATQIVIGNVGINPSSLQMSVDYCWMDAKGKEYDCDRANVTLTDAQIAGVLLKAKQAVRDKEGVK